MAKPKNQKDEVQQLAKAFAHPLRVRILSILEQGLASPNEMAAALGEPLSNVSYHTKALLEYDCIELVKTEPRRGVVEHYYQLKPHAALGSRQWRKVPKTLRGKITAAVLTDFIAHAVEALELETFQERDGSHLSAVPMMLDEPGWTEMVSLLNRTEGRINQVIQKCAERMKDPAAGIPALVSLAVFEIPGRVDGRPRHRLDD